MKRTIFQALPCKYPKTSSILAKSKPHLHWSVLPPTMASISTSLSKCSKPLPIALRSSTSSPTRGRRLPVLLFDVMGTLVRDPFYQDVHSFFRMSFQELITSKHPTAWFEFEKGLINEEELAQKFFLDQRHVDIEGLKRCMREGYNYLDGIEALLHDLKKANYEMHALTNYPNWYMIIEDKLKLSSYLSWTFCSCHLGKRKPDLDLFSDVSKHLGIEPENCVFVDDRSGNVEAARKAGMVGLHFKTATRLQQDLHVLGIEILVSET